uniref:Retrotransposon gag domain-containing protein n=1 Tax=Nicotiana tabacum TaxID=4097 RepID=A0A1S4AW93_TOBAC|nr:PREDICTED: uncharacterized protein LOC107801979 [Nicotiana tabacum]
MVDKFIIAHTGAKKAEARVNDIFAIKQSLGDGLRDFLTRFNRVRMTLSNVSEGMAVAAFQNGLSRDGSIATRKLLSRLMKYSLTTWDEIHNAYCAEVQAGMDDLNRPTHRLTSVQAESRKERRDSTRRDHLISRPNREQHQSYVRAATTPSLHYEEVGLIGTKETQTPENSTRSMISTRNAGTKQKIASPSEELLSNKGRTNFARGREHQGPPNLPSPARTINMIICGGEDASINGVKFTTPYKLKRFITRERYDVLEESIIFNESNIDGLTFPHNDALVITLCILDIDVKCIMVNDGSGACIIHPRVLTQMRLEDKIVPRCITITIFNNAVEWTSGEITLPVLTSSETLETTFHIMDQDTAYNAIVWRPWIHPMRVIPSSLYQIIKFPTPWEYSSYAGNNVHPRNATAFP